MSERKVFQKWIPPNMDPAKVPGRGTVAKLMGLKQKPRQLEVRYMMPFTLKCGHCGEFMYTGKKFNSRVEKIQGEDYLGLPMYRIYGKCDTCRGEFLFRTDPRTSDYVVLAGGTRTYSANKDAFQMAQALEEQAKVAAEDLEVGLEMKSNAAAKEMAMQERLQELRARSRKVHTAANLETAIKMVRSLREKEERELEGTAPGSSALNDDDYEDLRRFREMRKRAKAGEDDGAAIEDADTNALGDDGSSSSSSDGEDALDISALMVPGQEVHDLIAPSGGKEGDDNGEGEKADKDATEEDASAAPVAPVAAPASRVGGLLSGLAASHRGVLLKKTVPLPVENKVGAVVRQSVGTGGAYKTAAVATTTQAPSAGGLLGGYSDSEED